MHSDRQGRRLSTLTSADRLTERDMCSNVIPDRNGNVRMEARISKVVALVELPEKKRFDVRFAMK